MNFLLLLILQCTVLSFCVLLSAQTDYCLLSTQTDYTLLSTVYSVLLCNLNTKLCWWYTILYNTVQYCRLRWRSPRIIYLYVCIYIYLHIVAAGRPARCRCTIHQSRTDACIYSLCLYRCCLDRSIFAETFRPMSWQRPIARSTPAVTFGDFS